MRYIHLVWGAPNNSYLKGSVLDGRPSLTCIKENVGGETVEQLDLREVHVLRDSWTKLNVYPAKIMQVTKYTLVYGVLYVGIVVH